MGVAMINEYQRTTRILNDPMSLGRSFIETITMNGSALPDWLDFDAEHGQITRNSGDVDHSMRYVFEYQYWRPSRTLISTNKTEIISNGTDSMIIDIVIADVNDVVITPDAEISLALHKYNGIQWLKRDTIVVSIIDGMGSTSLTFDANTSGLWKMTIDSDIVNETWQRPAAIGNEIEFQVVEA